MLRSTWSLKERKAESQNDAFTALARSKSKHEALLPGGGTGGKKSARGCQCWVRKRRRHRCDGGAAGSARSPICRTSECLIAGTPGQPLLVSDYHGAPSSPASALRAPMLTATAAKAAMLPPGSATWLRGFRIGLSRPSLHRDPPCTCLVAALACSSSKAKTLRACPPEPKQGNRLRFAHDARR